MLVDRVLIVGIALALVAPVAARQAPVAAPTDDPAKPEVQAFELVLKSAVENGGRRFAERASAIWPMIEWEPGEAAIVNGEIVHALGIYMFEIQVPALNQTSIQATRIIPRRPRSSGGPADANAQQVSTTTASTTPAGGERVAATGTVMPDPMTPSSSADFDPTRDYSEGVKTELIDALVNQSRLLAIGPSDSIVIVAGGDDSSVPVLYRTARKLVLTIKGSDLADFRAGKIDSDEIRRRIKEEHF